MYNVFIIIVHLFLIFLWHDVCHIIIMYFWECNNNGEEKFHFCDVNRKLIFLIRIDESIFSQLFL